MQVCKLAQVLRSMEQGVRNRQHQIRDDTALVGRLRSEDVESHTNDLGQACFTANVKSVKAASIDGGKAVVRTVTGNNTAGRTTVEYWALLPYKRRDGDLNPCVLKIKQLLLVSRPGLGWSGDLARVVTGELFEANVVRGAGLVSTYNDEPERGACHVPTLLHVPGSAKSYPWAAHVHQIGCPLVRAEGSMFVTFQKMGFHG